MRAQLRERLVYFESGVEAAAFGVCITEHLQRLDEIGITLLRFRRAGGALGRLHGEPLRLFLAVVQLAERIRELHAAHDCLEALDERVVVVRRARERRQLDRPVVDDGRLDQLRLDEVRVRMVDELRPGLVARDVDPCGDELAAQLGLVPGPDAVRVERVDELHARPRLREVDLVLAEGRLRSPDRRLSGLLDERLGARHRVGVVRVGLVPLDLRELR